MSEDWKVIYSANKLYKAEMVSKHLEEHGIKGFIMNKKDSSYLIGDIEVMVQAKYFNQAKELINQMNLE